MERSVHTSPFATKLAAKYRDLDAQGHMYFLNCLVYVDEALGIFMEGFRQSCLE